MSLTGLVRPLFANRWRELEKHINEGEQLQRQVLAHLVQKAQDTEYGRKHLFSATKSYEDFVRNNPVNTYEELKGDIDRMRQGESDVLWPGRVKWYAKSSGTTNDKSKFIPVSQEGLQKIHYAGGYDSVALYLGPHPGWQSCTQLQPARLVGGRPQRHPHREHQPLGEHGARAL